MSAEIIELAAYRIGMVLKGVRFPQIYRASHEDQYAYLLSPDGPNCEFATVQGTIEKAKVEPIQFLNEGDGWLMFRHHYSEEHLDGWLDCLMEHSGLDVYDWGATICRTDQGIFSLFRRPKIENQPDALIFYTTWRIVEDGVLAGELDIARKCIDRHGNELDSDAILFPYSML